MIRFFQYVPRYTLVALACAAVHNAVLIGMDRLGFGIIACQAASALILLPLGFILQTHFTFAAERSWLGFLRYSAALITNFPIALTLLWITRDLMAAPMWIAGPATTVLLYLWNYATSRWALAARSGRDVERAAHG